jgi:radical SAM protein with 4Fe4S-binding SPASM domain
MTGEHRTWWLRERERATIFGGGALPFLLAADYVRVRLAPERPPRPRLVQIEPTRECNLGCVMCLRTARPGEAAVMDFERFRGLQERSFPHRHTVLLYGQGEPLLCPDLIRMIRFARERGNRVVSVTNGTLLDEAICAEIAASGLDILRVSIDGASEETYRRVRRGGTLDSVLQNVRRLQERIRREGKGPRLVVTFMAVQENCADIPAMVELTAGLGLDRLEIKDLPPYLDSPLEPLSVAAARDPDFGARLAALLREARARARSQRVHLVTGRFGSAWCETSCLNPWFKCCVSADGSLAPCSKLCFAPEARLGRLPEDDFDSIWRGSEYARIREETRAGRAAYEGCRRTSTRPFPPPSFVGWSPPGDARPS